MLRLLNQAINLNKLINTKSHCEKLQWLFYLLDFAFLKIKKTEKVLRILDNTIYLMFMMNNEYV